MTKKMNVLALVAGILTIVLPYVVAIFFGIIAGIVGIISSLSKWNVENGIPGLILSIIGLVLLWTHF